MKIQTLSVYSQLTHQMDTQLSKELFTNPQPPARFLNFFLLFWGNPSNENKCLGPDRKQAFDYMNSQFSSQEW